MSSANPVQSAQQTPAPSSGSQLLFYGKPEALTAECHGKLWLKKTGDFRFARNTNSVGITSTEFAQTMRFYPIVFSAGNPYPVAILGLQEKNLFVDDAGLWRPGHYVLAYMRRYPFVFITHPDGKQFILGIDRACDRFTDGDDAEAARPLYEDGKPSAAVQEALKFCSAYQADHGFTLSFASALTEQNLLIDNQAQIKLPGGRKMSLAGFKVIDREKYAKLSDAVVVDWHKKGWLMLADLHLASLERFQHLLELQGATQANKRAD